MICAVVFGQQGHQLVAADNIGRLSTIAEFTHNVLNCYTLTQRSGDDVQNCAKRHRPSFRSTNNANLTCLASSCGWKLAIFAVGITERICRPRLPN